MPKSFILSDNSRKRHLLYGTAVGVLLAVGASEKVYAACAPAFTAGNDVVTCSGAALGNLSALSGNDFVNLFSGNATALNGDDNDDTLIIGTAGSIDNAVSGNSGNDTLIVISGGDVNGNVDGGGSNDFITISQFGSADVVIGANVGGTVVGNLGNDVIFVGQDASVLEVQGNEGNDIITITQGSVDDDVEGGDGNDTISLVSTEIGDDVDGGSGNDTISFTSGSVNDIIGGANDDSIVVGALASVANNVDGGDGNDRITIAGGSVNTDVLGSAGDDIMTMAGGSVGDDFDGGAGNDTLVVQGGTISGDVDGNSGNDSVVMSSGFVAGDLDGELGSDLIVLTGGTVGEDIEAGSGSDTISMGGGIVFGSVVGNDGNDTIVMTGGGIASGDPALENDIEGGAGNDQITVTGGSIGDNVEGGVGDDTITIAGGDVGTGSTGGDLLGGSGNDTMIVTGLGEIGSGLDGTVAGNSGNDQITIDGGFVEEDVLGNDGSDTISIAGAAAIDDDVQGNSGSDTIVMTGGLVGSAGDGDLQGNDGDDQMTVAGGTVTDDVEGNSGNDTISVGGTAVIDGDVLGNSGNDTIVMTAGVVGSAGDGDLFGGTGNDQITMTGGTVTDDVSGGNGNDTVTIAGGFVGDEVRGLDGDDTLSITGGSIGDDVEGNDGNDQISIGGGAIALDVEGGNGDDSMWISGGSMQDVFGGSGNDTIAVSGLADLEDDTIGGDNGDDTISLHGGEINNANVLGGSGNDTVDVNGAGGADYLRSVDELFGGTGTNDVALFSGFAGELSEEFGGFEQVLLLNSTTLDVHNPGSASPLDRDLSAGASGVPNILYTDSTSTLYAGADSPGDFTWTGDQANLGVATMIDGSAEDRYTVTGNYAGNGSGVLGVDAALDASENSDLFFLGAVADVSVPAPVGPIVVGEGTSGLLVNDVGNGIGQLTGDGPGAGIAVIIVTSGNTDADDFFLINGPIQAGAVEYSLDLEPDGVWYLQSEFLDQVFGYAAAPSAILGMARDYMGDLKERVGAREQTWSGGATQISDGSGVWLRSGGFFGEVDGDTDFQELDYDQNHYFAQLGADLSLMSDDSSGHLIASIMGHAGYSETHHDEGGNNEIAQDHIHAYGGGLALTWYGGQGEGWMGEGLYVDGIAQVTFYEMETKTTAEGTRGETDGWGWSIGVETGYAFNIGGERDGPRLVPQLQLVYSQISLDDFTDEEGVIVEFDNADSLEGRLGVAIDFGQDVALGQRLRRGEHRA